MTRAVIKGWIICGSLSCRLCGPWFTSCLSLELRVWIRLSGFMPKAILGFKCLGEKNTAFSKTTLLQRGSILTVFYNINSSPERSLPSKFLRSLNLWSNYQKYITAFKPDPRRVLWLVVGFCIKLVQRFASILVLHTPSAMNDFK